MLKNNGCLHSSIVRWVHRRLFVIIAHQRQEQTEFGTYIGRWYDGGLHLSCDETYIVVIVIALISTLHAIRESIIGCNPKFFFCIIFEPFWEIIVGHIGDN
jgi:hypothetical protein